VSELLTYGGFGAPVTDAITLEIISASFSTTCMLHVPVAYACPTVVTGESLVMLPAQSVMV